VNVIKGHFVIGTLGGNWSSGGQQALVCGFKIREESTCEVYSCKIQTHNKESKQNEVDEFLAEGKEEVSEVEVSISVLFLGPHKSLPTVFPCCLQLFKSGVKLLNFCQFAKLF